MKKCIYYKIYADQIYYAVRKNKSIYSSVILQTA